MFLDRCSASSNLQPELWAVTPRSQPQLNTVLYLNYKGEQCVLYICIICMEGGLEMPGPGYEVGLESRGDMHRSLNLILSMDRNPLFHFTSETSC